MYCEVHIRFSWQTRRLQIEVAVHFDMPLWRAQVNIYLILPLPISVIHSAEEAALRHNFGHIIYPSFRYGTNRDPVSWDVSRTIRPTIQQNFSVVSENARRCFLGEMRLSILDIRKQGTSRNFYDVWK